MIESKFCSLVGCVVRYASFVRSPGAALQYSDVGVMFYGEFLAPGFLPHRFIYTGRQSFHVLCCTEISFAFLNDMWKVVSMGFCLAGMTLRAMHRREVYTLTCLKMKNRWYSAQLMKILIASCNLHYGATR
jgi:hypothetical protein